MKLFLQTLPIRLRGRGQKIEFHKIKHKIETQDRNTRSKHKTETQDQNTRSKHKIETQDRNYFLTKFFTRSKVYINSLWKTFKIVLILWSRSIMATNWSQNHKFLAKENPAYYLLKISHRYNSILSKMSKWDFRSCKNFYQ